MQGFSNCCYSFCISRLVFTWEKVREMEYFTLEKIHASPPKFFAICLNLYLTRGRSRISHLSHTTWLTNRNLYDPCSSNVVTVLLVRQSSFYFALILNKNSKSVFKRELQTEIIIYLECKTYQINDNIFAELSSPFCCNFTHMHHSLWVISIHMKNRSIYYLKNKIFRWRS